MILFNSILLYERLEYLFNKKTKCMKLIIQIPAYNEEISLPLTLSSISRQYEGIDEVEILVINDGSTDRTQYIAEEYGVEHI